MSTTHSSLSILAFTTGLLISFTGLTQHTTPIEAAQQLLNKGEYMQALVKLDSVIVEYPEQAEAYALRGHAKADLGDCAGAIESWDIYRSLDKENSWKVDGLKADCYIQQGKHEEAIDAISKHLIHDPHNGHFYVMRGHEYYLTSQYALAIQDFTTVIDRKFQGYNTFEVFYKRGLTYAEFGMNKEALQDFDKVVKIYPQFNYGYFYRGSCYWQMLQYEKAIADFTTAIHLDGKDLHSYFNRGLCYLSEKHYDQALADFNQVIELDPGFEEAYNQRALTTFHSGNWVDAEKSFNDYILKFSEHSHAYYNRGMFYAERKQYKKALIDFDYCLQLNPKDGEAHLQKAIALIASEQEPEACKELEKAAALGNGEAKKMQKKTCGSASR
jgi:tetratricopeptide (TPR) repeat protein